MTHPTRLRARATAAALATPSPAQPATERPEPAVAFTLQHASSLLHAQAYGTQAAQLATKPQFSAFFDHAQELSNMAEDLDESTQGLELFVRLVRDGGEAYGLQAREAQAICGALMPLRRELERCVGVLRAALGEPSRATA